MWLLLLLLLATSKFENWLLVPLPLLLKPNANESSVEKKLLALSGALELLAVDAMFVVFKLEKLLPGVFSVPLVVEKEALIRPDSAATCFRP